jgi:hypothetical protein
VGVSDPEIQKKVFGPRWQHEVAKQGWPSGKDSFIACNAARFASLKRKIARINESSRLLA